VFSVSDLETIDEELRHCEVAAETKREVPAQAPVNAPNSEDLGHLIHGVLENSIREEMNRKFPISSRHSMTTAQFDHRRAAGTRNKHAAGLHAIQLAATACRSEAMLPRDRFSNRGSLQLRRIVRPSRLWPDRLPVSIGGGRLGHFSITKQATVSRIKIHKSYWIIMNSSSGLRVGHPRLVRHPPTRVAIITFRPKVTVTECE